jgi:hypothetical protein
MLTLFSRKSVTTQKACPEKAIYGKSRQYGKLNIEKISSDYPLQNLKIFVNKHEFVIL